LLSIPYKNTNILSYLHELGKVREKTYLENSIEVRVLIPKHALQRVECFKIDKAVKT
ncbi:unnamed protein product, partial [marine sediment metagenome]